MATPKKNEKEEKEEDEEEESDDADSEEDSESSDDEDESSKKPKKQGRLAPMDKKRLGELKNQYVAIAAQIAVKKEELKDKQEALGNTLDNIRSTIGNDDATLAEILKVLNTV